MSVMKKSATAMSMAKVTERRIDRRTKKKISSPTVEETNGRMQEN
jgi:hypothetical protein